MFFLEKELTIYQEIFSFSKVTTRFFKHTKNLNASHFPFGAKPINIPIHLPVKHDVLFVGSADLRRILLLEHIKEHVSIFGNRWQRNYPLVSDALQIRITDRAVWGEELYALLASANIVLNITRTHFYGAETGVNLRLFEALAAGCFLLTDDCEEVAELFEVGMEIEVFKNATELKEKIAYYLAHPAEREAIAKRGHAKFLKNYTWKIRVLDLSQRLQLVAV